MLIFLLKTYLTNYLLFILINILKILIGLIIDYYLTY